MSRRLTLGLALLLLTVFGVGTAAALQAPPMQLVSVLKEISVPLLLIVLSVVGGGWGVAQVTRMVRTTPATTDALASVATDLRLVVADFRTFLREQDRIHEPRARAFQQVGETADKICELVEKVDGVAGKVGDVHRWMERGVVDRRGAP